MEGRIVLFSKMYVICVIGIPLLLDEIVFLSLSIDSCGYEHIMIQ